MSDWRSPVLSFRLDQKVPAIALLLAAVGFAAIVLNVGRGEYPIAGTPMCIPISQKARERQ